MKTLRKQLLPGALAPAPISESQFPVLNRRFPFLLGLLALVGGLAHAGPVGTAFTYQGRLAEGGNPAQGVYDLRFAVYAEDSGGSPVGGPVTNSAVAVSNGLFAATLDFGEAVFTGEARWLDIGVRSSGAAEDFTPLSPRQPLTPAPYALSAANVTGPINGGLIIGGTITGAQLAAGAVTASNIASNSITAGQLAPGAAAGNLNAAGQSAVASGGMVLSTNYNDTNLVNAGYVRLGKVELGDVWEQRSTSPQASARSGHTAVWTGTEMIVWGGSGYGPFVYLDDGGRYNPAGDNWTPISTVGAPWERASHTAVWTGTEMIVWGGYYNEAVNQGVRADGARYSPSGDSWVPMSTSGAPAGRQNHTAVWTGTEMIVWGGADSDGGLLNNGGRYSPAENTWTAVSTSGAPSARQYHTAVWTGNEMIVWGGAGSSGALIDGGRYSPSGNSWTALSTTGAPPARFLHTAVWTGTEMIVWGGAGSGGGVLNNGGRYSPAENTWAAVSTSGAPSARQYHTAVWTGNEMIVWGGQDSSGIYLGHGGRYSPAGNSWTDVSTVGEPGARASHTAVWTGTEMIVWGGYYYDFGGTGDHFMADGARYSPSGNSWLPVGSAHSPSSRAGHTAVWTGSEMIVWGGYYSSKGLVNYYFNDGGRFDPAANTWTALSTDGAPSPRINHTAVWTGNEMIVWGGDGSAGYNSVCFNSGGRYNPGANSWTAVSTNGAPAPRDSHTAVWTGSEMIVWGGLPVSFSYAFNDGGRYDPTSDSWAAVSTNGAPAGRAKHAAVWTGSEMIIWGGAYVSNYTYYYLNDGKRYNPAGDSWTAMTSSGAPIARLGATAVWTGNEMIVWGGSKDGFLNDGGRYNPGANSWTAVSTNGAPAPRYSHTAVWTGSEMIVWGGSSGYYLSDGGRYNPAGNSWTPMSTIGTPVGRFSHTAVWTGSEMIVWGGRGTFVFLGDTFSYLPSRPLYLYQRQ